MTVITLPGYGLAYVDVDSPVVELAAASEQTARATQAALAARGVTVPAAADLAALALRVAAVEGVAPVALTLQNAGHWPGLANLHAWKQGQTVHLSGAAFLNGNVAAGGRLTVATLPAGYRPPKALVGLAIVNGWITGSIDIVPDGRVIFRNDTGGAIGGSGNGGSWISITSNSFSTLTTPG